MKLAVCEDNDAERNDICGHIIQYCKKNRFLIDIHTYNSGEALLDAFPREKFDIIFLDIIMNGITGIDTARKIREADPLCTLVFITVCKDYALDAYSVDGLTYLLKPVKESTINRALDKCRQEFMKNSRYIQVPVCRQGKIRLPFAGIYYVEVYGREVWFHADSEKIKSSRLTMDEVERQLGGEPFLRCHRCYIVNMNYVEKLQNGSFLIRNGDFVPIRKRGYSKVQLAFSRFIAKSGFWGDSI